MSYRTEIFKDGEWRDLGLVFFSEFEAITYGRAQPIHSVYRAASTEDPPNYHYLSGKLVPGAGPRTILEWLAAHGGFPP